jgi:hypothetical protein
MEFEDKLFAYEPDSVEVLSELCQTMAMAYEYWATSKQKPVLYGPFQQELNQWLRNSFETQIILVLKFEDTFYSYSRKFVLKQLRGNVAHSDRERREKKNEALSNFVFEEDGALSTSEFAVTHGWIFTGGLERTGGNTDSNSPYRHRIGLNDREFFVTTIESVVINIALEFWFTLQEGEYVNSARLLQEQSLNDLIVRYGERIGNECAETMDWHRGMRLKDEAI